jgi:hypothetical protein
MVTECVKVPAVPVMVTVAGPVEAAPPAFNVKVLTPVAGFALKEAVTPPGRPEADRETPLLNPFCGVMLMMLVPLAPSVMLRLLGDAEREKFGTGAVTERLIVMVCDKLPEAPRMLTENVPVDAVLLAANVSVLDAFVLLGLKDAVTPLGRPEADRLTLPLKPLCGVTVIVLDPFAPCSMLKLEGDAESAKFGGAAVTVRLIVVVRVKFPAVPVIVTVVVPVVAVMLAVSVRMLVVVAVLGLNAAVTPLGRPEAERLTLLLKPLCGPTVTVLVPFVPWTMLRLLGETERV